MSESETVSASEFRTPGTAPMIFISHDTRDAEIAEAFSKLLTNVSAGVLKSFRSSDKTGIQGIEYGTDWYPRVMAQLAIASDVVCLLTARSVERPWILYEAGVAKGRTNILVHGVALGIPMDRASAGPFAQFQNCADDEVALTSLVMQLVSRIPGAEPDRDAVQMQVASFRTRAGKLLADIEKTVGTVAQKPDDTNTVAKLFEEVKVMFQDLPGRLDVQLRERAQKTNPSEKTAAEMLDILRGIVAGRVKVMIAPEKEADWRSAAEQNVRTAELRRIQTAKDSTEIGNLLLEELRSSPRFPPSIQAALSQCCGAHLDGDTLQLFWTSKYSNIVERRLTAEVVNEMKDEVSKFADVSKIIAEFVPPQ